MMEDPVAFRTSLLLSIAHLRFEGTSQEIERINLVHKIAVTDTINQRLASFSTHISEFFVLVIALLFQVEVGQYVDPLAHEQLDADRINSSLQARHTLPRRTSRACSLWPNSTNVTNPINSV